MSETKPKVDIKKVDTKEFELPETLFVRDIENRVFQTIVLQCLSQIEGIGLAEGNFIDNLFGRTSLEVGVKGIYAEQDNKNHSVGIKVEVSIYYGYSIPEKAEEIQTKIAEDITKMTGLHVSNVHVVFKNVLLEDFSKALLKSSEGQHVLKESNIEEEYSDEF
jgi:uncharacterized alkaline shock family protein YloU